MLSLTSPRCRGRSAKVTSLCPAMPLFPRACWWLFGHCLKYGFDSCANTGVSCCLAREHILGTRDEHNNMDCAWASSKSCPDYDIFDCNNNNNRLFNLDSAIAPITHQNSSAPSVASSSFSLLHHNHDRKRYHPYHHYRRLILSREWWASGLHRCFATAAWVGNHEQPLWLRSRHQ